MTDTPDWKPSEAMVETIVPLLSGYHRQTAYRPVDEAVSILLLVRPLIIAEEQPKIEAAERERYERRIEDLEFALVNVRPFFEGEHSYEHPHCGLIRWAMDGGEWPKGMSNSWEKIRALKDSKP